ncbi:response regulator transcription factor [Bacillus sp. DNRA2]|uniref:response regulator transcription factor n=1 Tax=Bacillus sp. DNRA2 TaxID=2723053 RepID=UPI00145F53FD|nr:response regulator transcription factor [Bacillus sp. DNRA2]NMD71628.1 response regulator transcription factor [Bacillus sp. DNRA2]
MEKILIVEDDVKIAELLQSYLERYGYEGKVVTKFDQVLIDFEQFQPHLVLLDINLPTFDGYYWCRQIRTISTCPIIFISARSGDMDQVMALENGGDDYITKPFHYEVIMAKIRSHLRRVYGEYAPKLAERLVELEGLILYPERLEASLNGITTIFTKKEAELLEMFLIGYPKIMSRNKILEKLWDDMSFVDDNTVSVNMTRLRKKLAEMGVEGAIETVRGAGYRLNPTWKKESQ